MISATLNVLFEIADLSLIQINQPTMANTNNNTRPVIQLHFIKIQPTLAWFSIFRGASRECGEQKSIYNLHWLELHSSPIFHGKDFKSSKTQSISLSRLAYRLGYILAALRHLA